MTGGRARGEGSSISVTPAEPERAEAGRWGSRVPITAEELRSIPYLAALGPEPLAALLPKIRERRCKRGTLLFLEGDPCEGLYYVQAGRVKIYKTSAAGREQVLAALGPGETFNDVPVFDGGPNPASAQALEPSRLFVVPSAVMHALLRSEPDVASAVVRIFAARLRHLTLLVEDLSLHHVASRVARLLLRQLEAGSPERLTQQEMAARVGTAREVVGRALRALEEAGAVELHHGHITVRDREALEHLA